jgi:hypothetical protein
VWLALGFRFGSGASKGQRLSPDGFSSNNKVQGCLIEKKEKKGGCRRGVGECIVRIMHIVHVYANAIRTWGLGAQRSYCVVRDPAAVEAWERIILLCLLQQTSSSTDFTSIRSLNNSNFQKR